MIAAYTLAQNNTFSGHWAKNHPQDYLIKRCQYLFISGVVEKTAYGGEIPVLKLTLAAYDRLKESGVPDHEAMRWLSEHGGDRVAAPIELSRNPALDTGYCRLFAE